ncbi:hypothetical protein GQX73_g803 [Xylaria multiplex]|uniref:Uncharacterized protein n=1 Tax=Xylaria multiplex TaxID=323545 RepID=A0A7C8MSU5_9PEZI|nr:hypothetical protein GQX73_g803 [Xylaria multiplex]
MQASDGLGGSANSKQPINDVEKGIPVPDTHESDAKKEKPSQPIELPVRDPKKDGDDEYKGPKQSDGGYGGSPNVPHSDPIDIAKKE